MRRCSSVITCGLDKLWAHALSRRVRGSVSAVVIGWVLNPGGRLLIRSPTIRGFCPVKSSGECNSAKPVCGCEAR
jgi:hypothetical protein